jgi:ABC-type branched-subunit amino acid transport system substrate-binding protein
MKKLSLLLLVLVSALVLSACTVEEEGDPLVCDEGQHEEEGICVDDTLVCADDEEEKDGECVKKPLECEDGWLEEAGACVEQESQGVTDTMIKVGNSAATSGGLAFVGTPFNAGIQAYFAMVNDAGGVNGRQIEFIHYDDEFLPANGVTYAEKLVEDDEVFAFVGHFGTPIVGATLDYLEAEGIPQVYYATGISALFNEEATGNEKASFPVQPIYDAEGQVMVARAVAEFSATKIGVIYTNDDAGKGILNGVEIQAAAAGVTLVKEQVAPTATDMSAAALALFSADVDAVIIAANQVPAEIAIKAISAAGNTSPAIVSYVNASPTFIANVAAELANFDIYSSAWINIFNDDMTTTDEYNEFVVEVSKIDVAYAANPYAMAGWIAAAFFVEGLERVGTDVLSWANYIEAMESAPVMNPLGGSVDFGNGRRAGTQSMSLLKATIIPGADGADDTYVFAAYKPMDTIDNILGE